MSTSYELGGVTAVTGTVEVRSASRLGSGQKAHVSALCEPGPRGAPLFVDTVARFASLVHPSVLQVEDVWEYQGRPFAISAPLAGAPLSRLLSVPAVRAVPLGHECVCALLLRIADAVHDVSEAFGGKALTGLCADSLWLTDAGAPLVLPAVRRNGGRSGSDAIERYRAPELGDSVPESPSSDVYSLGLLLWDLLSFGRSVLSMDTVDRTTSAATRIPSAVIDLVMRSLSSEPADRPSSPLEFLVELTRVTAAGRSSGSKTVSGTIPAETLSVLSPPVRGALEPAAVARGRYCGRPFRPELPVGPRLCLAESGRILPLVEGQSRWVVGRSTTADLSLPDPDLSRQHFEIVRAADGTHHAYDLGSKNGLYVNGVGRSEFVLSPGDEIFAGRTRIRFEP